jgi:FAD synthetase
MSELLRFAEAAGGAAEEAEAVSQARRRVAHALRVVAGARHVFRPGELCFSFNGGKDSTVVLHLLQAALGGAGGGEEGAERPGRLGGVRVVYFETKDQFPEVAAFMQDACASAGLRLERLPSIREGLATLAAEGCRAVFMGTRRGDPDGASLEFFSPTSLSWPGVMRINPILDWDYHDVWTVLRHCHIPYCSLYDLGYTSLGTTKNTRPNEHLAITDEPRDPHDPHATAPGHPPLTSRFRPAWQLVDGSLERFGRGLPPATPVAAPPE